MKEFREKHPKFTETTDKVLNKTNEVLETVAAKTSQLAAKVGRSSFLVPLSRVVVCFLRLPYPSLFLMLVLV